MKVGSLIEEFSNDNRCYWLSPSDCWESYISVPHLSGVYIIYSSVSGEIIYVGQSSNLAARLENHLVIKELKVEQNQFNLSFYITERRHDLAILFEAIFLSKFLTTYGKLPMYNKKI